MPFSVFRTAFLSFINLILLGLFLYCSADLYDRSQHNKQTYIVDPRQLPSDDAKPSASDPNLDLEAPGVTTFDKRKTDWTAVKEITFIGLYLLFSVGGRLPARIIFATASVLPKATTEPNKTLNINRPDGSILHLKIFGNDKSPTLILTHGWSLNSSAWNYMLPDLISRFRVVTWDLAGLGRSKGPVNGDYSVEKHAEDLNAILEQVSPNGPAILIGHSIGGMTLQTFSRLHSAKLGSSVKGLVFIHTTYTNPLLTNVASAFTKPTEPIIKLMNWMMIFTSPYLWLSNWQSYFNGSLHIAARIESFTGKQTWEQLDHSAKMGATAWPGVVARGNLGMIRFDESAWLPKISVPVLIVSGAHDRLTVESASETIRDLIPDSKKFSEKGGHLGHWEFNSEISKEIIDFVANVLRDQPNKEMHVAKVT